MAIPTSDMPGHQALHKQVVAALDTCVESHSGRIQGVGAVEGPGRQDVDDVVDAINRFASPPVSATIVTVTDRNGRRFLAIQVHEFGDTPIVCRRDALALGLRQGTVYVRPPGAAQTTEVRSAEHMHDLLGLAAEKRARRILETARRIGLEASSPRRPFDEELGGL